MKGPQLNQAFLFENAEYYEYATSADPIGLGLINPIPFRTFLHGLHETGPTQLIPLDTRDLLNCPYPATSPALLSNFIHILANENITISVNATSQLYYVIRGCGHSSVGDLKIPWNTGDFFLLPANSVVHHHADSEAAFYFVHDEPLLAYLGAKADKPQFNPTLYTAETAAAALQQAIEKSKVKQENRLSVLLANRKFPQTRTVSHVLWAMFGALLPDQVQPPHRHQSVAIDFAVDCQPGCYTLIGKELDRQNHIVDPVRVDWVPYSVFITPPGYWHSHHNESGVQAHVIPLQDAGLHTYLRTLDIQFATREENNLIG